MGSESGGGLMRVLTKVAKRKGDVFKRSLGGGIDLLY